MQRIYQRILVPIDGSPTSTEGLYEAMKLAQLTGGRLDLVHVVDELSLASGLAGYGALSPDWISTLIQGGRKILNDACAIAEAAGMTVDSCLIETLTDRVSHAVLKEAEAWQADLIVLGTHGRRGVKRLLLGSDAEQILRGSPVPVLLVRASGEARPTVATVTAQEALEATMA